MQRVIALKFGLDPREETRQVDVDGIIDDEFKANEEQAALLKKKAEEEAVAWKKEEENALDRRQAEQEAVLENIPEEEAESRKEKKADGGGRPASKESLGDSKESLEAQHSAIAHSDNNDAFAGNNAVREEKCEERKEVDTASPQKGKHEASKKDESSAERLMTSEQEEEARRLLAVEENVCASLYTQGLLYAHDGKLEDAEDWYKQALDAATTRLPLDHASLPMYLKALEAVQEKLGKGPAFEEASRIQAERSAADAAAAKAREEAAEAERLRKEAEATAWKRDPLKRTQTTNAAVSKRKAALAARGRDKLRRAMRKLRMIRLLGGDPFEAGYSLLAEI
jgi:fused signal recognition particle receptor